MSGRALPWYAWYPSDFLGAVRGWSILERGAYRDALDAQWTLDGLPPQPEEIRKILCATPTEFRRIWSRIKSKFPIAEDGRRRNPRLESERKHGNKVSALRAELGRLGAAKRWGPDGNSHGNGHSNSHPLAMPSTSTSTITQENSKTTAARKRARPASPDGSRARPIGEVNEADPQVQQRRREAQQIAAAAAEPKR